MSACSARAPMPGRLRTAVRALGLAGLVCLAAGAGAAAGAQTVEDVLLQRRLQYRAAKAEVESARSAAAVYEADFAAALEAADRARRAGDADARERALALAQDRSGPVRSQAQRVEEAVEVLDAAREALISIITVRMEQLVDRLNSASSAAERTRLDRIFQDLSNELQALEDEAGDDLRLDPVALPEVRFDPRDGPEELEIKAQLLERRAAIADSAIAEVDRDIGRLEDRLRIQRQRRDFLAGTDRFDDTRLPVVTGGNPGERTPAPADSTAAPARPLTLEERIAQARLYRQQLEGYRDQLLVRARTFRQAIRLITSGPAA